MRSFLMTWTHLSALHFDFACVTIILVPCPSLDRRGCEDAFRLFDDERRFVPTFSRENIRMRLGVDWSMPVRLQARWCSFEAEEDVQKVSRAWKGRSWPANQASKSLVTSCAPVGAAWTPRPARLRRMHVGCVANGSRRRLQRARTCGCSNTVVLRCHAT